jgi:hypothetical protein
MNKNEKIMIIKSKSGQCLIIDIKDSLKFHHIGLLSKQLFSVGFFTSGAPRNNVKPSLGHP